MPYRSLELPNRAHAATLCDEASVLVLYTGAPRSFLTAVSYRLLIQPDTQGYTYELPGTSDHTAVDVPTRWYNSKILPVVDTRRPSCLCVV